MQSFKGKEAKKPEFEKMIKNEEIAPGWKSIKVKGDADDVGTSIKRYAIKQRK